MHQSNQGPTFPAHQYIISGTSTISTGSNYVADNNPGNQSVTKNGGCDSSPSSTEETIDINTGNLGPEVYPCFERQTIFDLVMAGSPSLTWRYYQQTRGPGLKYAPGAIQHLYNSPYFSQWVKHPSSRVLTDIAKGNLANVSFVTPSKADSDHPEDNKGTGPAWVASIVNAVGESKYWNNTAIFITWDDWGAWFDHVPPVIYNANETGFRVPLIVVSAYTPQGYVSTVPHEFGSFLKYIEQNFGLGSLGTTDVRADNMADFFNYLMPPRTFRPFVTSKKR